MKIHEIHMVVDLFSEDMRMSLIFQLISASSSFRTYYPIKTHFAFLTMFKKYPRICSVTFLLLIYHLTYICSKLIIPCSAWTVLGLTSAVCWQDTKFIKLINLLHFVYAMICIFLGTSHRQIFFNFRLYLKYINIYREKILNTKKLYE